MNANGLRRRNCGPDGTPLDPPSRTSPAAAENVRVMDMPSYTPFVRDFDEVGQATIAASADFTPIVQFTAPAGQQGYVQFFGQDATTPAAFVNTRWRVRVSGEVRVLYPAVAQVGTLQQDGLVVLHAWFNPGETIYVEVANSDAVNGYTVAARIKGIYFPAMPGSAGT